MPPWRRFEATLMATSRNVRRVYDARMAHLQLNLSEACLLAYVDEHGPISQSETANRIGMGRASAGLMVDALSERGLLTREPDSGDRRVWRLSTTAIGHALCERVAAADAALRAELRVGVTRADRRQLSNILVSIQRNLVRALAESE
jgi:DNA-binding MarR family transcriptional regulator